jgi:Flp pilus assembly protein TadD
MPEELARYRRLAHLAPHDPELRLSFAKKLLDSSFLEAAVEEIRAVISMAPNNLEARKLLKRAITIRDSKPARSHFS